MSPICLTYLKTWSPDVGWLSVCCEHALLPVVNKDTTLAYDRVELRNPNRYREEESRVGEMLAVAREARCEVTSQESRGRI